NGQDVTRGPLVVRRAADAGAVPVEVTTRVGIRHCADWPLRFYIRGNYFVSRPAARRGRDR
ncbi:MAG TPA: hypothetical protein VEU62_14385, partial [Bryobacterales bacterium]|nr:hypothetical protein [Bryobacterales bacterium]